MIRSLSCNWGTGELRPLDGGSSEVGSWEKMVELESRSYDVRARLRGRWCSVVGGSCVRKCGVGGRVMCPDELVDGTARSIVTVLGGGAVLVVMSVSSSMVMMIMRW